MASLTEIKPGLTEDSGISEVSRPRPNRTRPRSDAHSDSPPDAHAGSDTASVAGRKLVSAGRWLLVAAVVFAPWAYGCTRSWAIEILNLGLFTAAGVWIAGCGLTRTWPRLPAVLAVALFLILLQGWWMTSNAGFSYDPELRPQPRAQWSSALPAAVDHAAALPTMIRLTALCGVLAMAVEAGSSRRWRIRLWLAMALTGVSIIVLGLCQKFSHAPGIFWQAEGHAPTFFGTFRYHANAGSFINIVWPLCAALLACSIGRLDSPARRIGWAFCFVIAISGALVNTSRASGFIALALLGAWLAWLGVCRWRRRDGAFDPAAILGVALLLGAVVFSAHAAGGFDTILKRWKYFDNELRPENSRLMVARVCMEMLPQSGWFGFGPGTFRTAFPFFNKDTTGATSGVWLDAHQDYLQTLVEWGWCGAALWACVLGGGLISAARAARRHRHDWRSRDRVLQLAASTSVGAVLLHSLVDFPMQIASIQLYVFVLIGLLWSARRWRAAEKSEHRSF